MSPKFEKAVIQSQREDGYWVEPFKLDPNDKAPGLIAYDDQIFGSKERGLTPEFDLDMDLTVGTLGSLTTP